MEQAATYTPTPLSEKMHYQYDGPEDPRCPSEHFFVCAMKLANPAATCTELAPIFVQVNGGSLATARDRIGRILGHGPNAQWLRDKYLSLSSQSAAAAMTFASGQKVVAERLMGMIDDAPSAEIALKAISLYLKHFGVPTMNHLNLGAGNVAGGASEPEVLDVGGVDAIMSSLGGDQ